MNKNQSIEQRTCQECGASGVIGVDLFKDEIYDSAFSEDFDTIILYESCEDLLEMGWCSKCGRAFNEGYETKFITPNPKDEKREHKGCRRCWEERCLERGQPLYTIKPKNIKWSWYSDEQLKGWELHSQHSLPDRLEELVDEAKMMHKTHKVVVKMFAISCLGNEGHAGLYVMVRKGVTVV